MGKISKCFYRLLEEEDCSVREAADFYFYSNMMTANDDYMKFYEDYDIKQTNRKNHILGEVLIEEGLSNKVKAHTTNLAISTMKNRVVIYSDA